MVCGDCVQKLALRLVKNHKLDLIHALTLAQKGMERREKRVGPGVEGKDDYTQNCVGSTPSHPELCGTQSCMIWANRFCRSASDCSGTCVCPDPLENSHQVSSTCSCEDCCGDYPIGTCPEGCNCKCTGSCGYDCDPPYTWDPVLEECVLAAKKPFGDGLVFAE